MPVPRLLPRLLVLAILSAVLGTLRIAASTIVVFEGFGGRAEAAAPASDPPSFYHDLAPVPVLISDTTPPTFRHFAQQATHRRSRRRRGISRR